MNEVRLETLREEDFAPYLKKISVVRLWKKYWFIGILRRMSLEDHVCRVRFYPRIRYRSGRAVDPLDPRDVLVCRDDRIVIERRDDDSQAFVLDSPNRCLTAGENVLVMQSGQPDLWTAVISSRPNDLEIVEDLLGSYVKS